MNETLGVIPTTQTNNNILSSITEYEQSSYKVLKRNGEVSKFNITKISAAISKAFTATKVNLSQSDQELITKLTSEVSNTVMRRNSMGTPIHIENIQDQVELSLMRNEEREVARNFVLYREKHAIQRQQQQEMLDKEQKTAITVIQADGTKKSLDIAQLKATLDEACFGIKETDPELILQGTLRSLYNNMPVADIYKAIIMTIRVFVELEPNYTYVCSRILLNNIRSEVIKQIFDKDVESSFDQMKSFYPQYFKEYIKYGIKSEFLDPRLQSEFNLNELSKAIVPDRDLNFTFLGLQTLYDRYLIHINEQRIELPQAFFMRVSMGLAINEQDKTTKTIEFYNVLSKFDFMSSTPTLFNSGTLRPQLSSCYLSTIPDDLDEIYNGIKDNALLSKYAGGLGNDWTPVRAMGARIKGTNGKSQGIVPFLKVANDTAIAVNQGGKRKGALCTYLETWHLDIEDYLELRKNTGDERRRTHDMNTANWIPDLFMKRVAQEQNWTLFSPDTVPDLHNLYGKSFEKRYTYYEQNAEKDGIPHKTVKAIELWRKMLGMLFETGHPWITFKDPCNIRSPQQHAGVVHSSNLCTEITLNTSSDEIAVCNLGSINLVSHITKDGKLDIGKIKKTVKTGMRMLDNVIDYNFYCVEKAANSNFKHRPVGFGLMGFHDVLQKLSIPYASEKAVNLADKSMEAISYYVIDSSIDLAEERGSYPTYEGSFWSKGILPIDSIKILEEERGGFLQQNSDYSLDWQPIRDKLSKFGIRNSNTLAIAPTATIANIIGVSQSIDPIFQNLYSKSNLSGEFIILNQYLVNDLKAINLWDESMVNDLKYYDGSIKDIERIPQNLKDVYATAFEISPGWLIESASRRQKWIDQAQSFNLYVSNIDGKALDSIYKKAWISGLKTTYYLRSLSATNVEKSTLNTSVDLKNNLSSVMLSDGVEQGVTPATQQKIDNKPQKIQQAKPAICDIFGEGCLSCQ